MKEIPGYPGIYVTEDGQIYSGLRDGIYLKQQENNKGYMTVRVTVGKEKKVIRVHRAVAEAFIPNPMNKLQVNHKDGNKKNNSVDNLEWVTNKENAVHAMKYGLWENVFEASRKTNEARKTPIVATNIITGESIVFPSMSAAERYCGTRHINEVLKGTRSQAKGYKFGYVRG